MSNTLHPLVIVVAWTMIVVELSLFVVMLPYYRLLFVAARQKKGWGAALKWTAQHPNQTYFRGTITILLRPLSFGFCVLARAGQPLPTLGMVAMFAWSLAVIVFTIKTRPLQGLVDYLLEHAVVLIFFGHLALIGLGII